MNGHTSFDVGCELIRLHDQARELGQAGWGLPPHLNHAIRELTRMWDAARRRDLAEQERAA